MRKAVIYMNAETFELIADNKQSIFFDQKYRLLAPEILHDTKTMSHDGEAVDFITCDDEQYIAYMPDSTSKKEVLFYCDDEGLIPVIYRTKRGLCLKLKPELTDMDVYVIADCYGIFKNAAALMQENYREDITSYVAYVTEKIERTLRKNI